MINFIDMKKINSYAMPVFPTGTGLGNRIFHWCDAKVYSYRTECQFISPRWSRISLGKHLRRLAKGQISTDPLVEYANTFRHATGDLPYYKGILKCLFYPKVLLSQNPDLSLTSSSHPRVIYFDKSQYRFDGFEPWRHRLTQDFFASTQQRLVARANLLENPYIGIHARLGDGFKPPSQGCDGFIRTGWLQQTPIEWFKETLRLTREATGVNYRAYIFSDGDEKQLRPLLDEENTFLWRSQNPLCDMLALSRSWLILGSGSSSFSAFAAYFGSSHAITAPGHPFTTRGLTSSKDQVIESLNPRAPEARDKLKKLRPT